MARRQGTQQVTGHQTRRVTLRDVAALAGVDPSAVSRAVNNDPRLRVSQETRERILAAVEQLGYRPNFGARGLQASRAWTVGFILPSLANPMYESIVRGVETAAESYGYNVVLGSQVEGRSAEAFARLLQEGRVDGLLVASGSLQDDFIREIMEHGPGPVITVNRRVRGVEGSVVVDDEGASAKAVRYLQGLGHTVVGGVFGPAAIDTSVRRRKGFARAVKQGHLRAVYADRSSWSALDGYLGTGEILRTDSEVTAIYASTLLMGIGALRAAAEAGRRVPSDLSVMCLHESNVAEFLNPPLTTVLLPTELLGAAAIELLIECRDGKRPRSIMIDGDGEVIERRSTGPARVGSFGRSG